MLKRIVREIYQLDDIEFDNLNREIEVYGDRNHSNEISETFYEYTMRSNPEIRLTLDTYENEIELSYLEGTDETTLEPLRQILDSFGLEEIIEKN